MLLSCIPMFSIPQTALENGYPSILFYMKNPMAMKIEGRRDSVKKKGELLVVGVEYDKYNVALLRLWKQVNLRMILPVSYLG